MSEHRTIEEGYQSATNSGNLAVDLEHRTDADWMIASGWSHRQLGADLMRLQSEWSGFKRNANPALDEANAREAIDRLRTLPSARKKLVALVHRYGLRDDAESTVLKVLIYWLDDTCQHCHGQGYVLVSGTPRLSGKRCKSCRGSGKKTAPGRAEARKLLCAMDQAVMLHRDYLRKVLRNTHASR